MAMVEVAHTYSFMAEAGLTLPRDGGILLPYAVAPHVPVPRPGIEHDANDRPAVTGPEVGRSSADVNERAEEETNDAGTDRAVPPLLLRAYQVVLAAGGTMYGTDLAEALDIRAQQIGKDLTRMLRAVGISRPGNGAVRVTPDEPYRNGYLAETLAAYRVRAELADAS
ncbi:hypothetical protein [Streptomyces aculeolatus]|uniref:hypothetical protein n=1 Tax=Streptomyces aculeolatus TaxID=270689 RepID=UPI001CEC919F|nr:hypothetical protein [Streptomyces aculeolatus]